MYPCEELRAHIEYLIAMFYERNVPIHLDGLKDINNMLTSCMVVEDESINSLQRRIENMSCPETKPKNKMYPNVICAQIRIAQAVAQRTKLDLFRESPKLARYVELVSDYLIAMVRYIQHELAKN